MAIFGSIGTVRSQVAPPFVFAAAFEYLSDVLREGSSAALRIRGIPVGETQKIELGKGVFALEQVYRSKVRADGFFESHRKYIDVQVVLDGYEWMEVADVGATTVRQPYNSERDFIVYENVPEASALRVGAGDVAVFFPADVHMPALCGKEGALVVRKTVVKVPVSAL
jgi:YhcH/YjgK/YiaL family protein